MANWLQIKCGNSPLPPDVFPLAALTAWTCRPGRNHRPGPRWQVNAVGSPQRVQFRPTRVLKLETGRG